MKSKEKREALDRKFRRGGFEGSEEKTKDHITDRINNFKLYIYVIHRRFSQFDYR